MSRQIFRPPPRGFSLVEILIVVMIIGILAAIAIPKFANASHIARENSLKDDLRLLRTQIGVYQSQHGIYPGYPNGDGGQNPTAQAFSDQLLKYSDNTGNTSDTSSTIYKWGPYLLTLPANPVNGNATLTMLMPGDSFIPDDTTGWLYQPSSGTLKANVVGNDSNGKPIIDY